jgi:hypothetical protein
MGRRLPHPTHASRWSKSRRGRIPSSLLRPPPDERASVGRRSIRRLPPNISPDSAVRSSPDHLRTRAGPGNLRSNLPPGQFSRERQKLPMNSMKRNAEATTTSVLMIDFSPHILWQAPILKETASCSFTYGSLITGPAGHTPHPKPPPSSDGATGVPPALPGVDGRGSSQTASIRFVDGLKLRAEWTCPIHLEQDASPRLLDMEY